ncbi:hypothetical protein ACFSC6_10375 [Rufibacter sediminis]|uniref:Uncharacterized protein n=1 Tax=Rufibacter sediminis TaxID=2762756 RepID=A0ABR6VQT5_9BACT|nr:hypothetical protein [Rufibacter sediminis]MBC3538941.1 hypothetical protein [Rufibacter sediminis]
MRTNENQFLLLALLLREVREYQLKKASMEVAVALLDQIKGTVSIIDYDNRQEEVAVLVLATLESLSLAGTLARRGHVPKAFTGTRLALLHLLRKAALFRQP